MVVSKMLKSQIRAKHNELVDQLQVDARMLFFDRMMYDINDSLTSILAVCEVEPKEAIPKIKQYIHRINQSLHTTKNYQNNCNGGEKRFNVTQVSKNLIRVVKENFKESKLTSLISDIKAPVQGDQSKFEQLLLHILVNILSEEDTGDSEILIELRQKDENAMITILKDHHTFSEKSLEQIDKIREDDDFKGSVQITPQGKGIEVIIKIPLQFKVIKLSDPLLKVDSTAFDRESSKKVIISQKKSSKIDSLSSTGSLTTPGLAF